ncbi:nuclear transport factor 2 family protein [Novosphingobium flavum]|uniref:Nuclear transport factor 2 family protein n=1 Tax=Novosphingobium flavum TaxID=1778672 RepID=A0A7X1FU35_9SPHN|nr:nuclear transport factor 2 family protein [Novosphingobium flavum]MBC2667009.1 nuclear transport factor 2 family protein [Novosphingobium flavum]
MTPSQRIEIEHHCARLVAHYANLNDAGHWDALAALFAPDGRFARPTAPDDWICGRDAILVAFRTRPARRARHLCANVVIDAIDAEHAIGQSALALLAEGSTPVAGSFHDRFVKTVDGWKFAERRGSLAF